MLFDTTAATLIARLFTLVIAFTVHEFAHAWTADYFGDDTPRIHGRLTLNPAAHLDVMGSVLILFAGFGWAKPVPVNPYALQRRHPAAMMIVALAGPVSNLLLAIVGAIPFQLGLLSQSGGIGQFFPTPSQLMLEFIWLNLVLLLFNLIPIYPLDGEKIAMYLLPPAGQEILDRMRPYSSLILLGVIFILPYVGINLLGWVIGSPLRLLFSLLIP